MTEAGPGGEIAWRAGAPSRGGRELGEACGAESERCHLREVYLPQVLRERQFQVNLRDTTTKIPFDPPEPFFRRHDWVIRPLPEIAEQRSSHSSIIAQRQLM